MKKLIDIDESILKHLKVGAADCQMNLKLYIQDLLMYEAEKLVYNQINKHEERATSKINDVLKGFSKYNILHSEFTFYCSMGDVNVYRLTTKTHMHEISIVSNNVCLPKVITSSTMFKRTPKYLSHVVHDQEKRSQTVVFTFNITDTDQWKKLFWNKDNENKQ